MKKFILTAIAFAFLLAFIVTPSKANAQQSIANLDRQHAALTSGVAPITCESYTACVLDYYGGTSEPNDGYWMAKRVDGGPWVRLTSVPGANNTNVAPISCTVEDMCEQSYYVAGHYWMAKNAGNMWVRETLYPTAFRAAGSVAARMPQSVQSSFHVPRITCQYPTDCIASYYENGSLEGYWMLRNVYYNGPWVRVSRVNGADWNNDYVAPISCPYSNSCVRGHWYDSWTDEGYDMLRQSAGSVWVRTSQIEEDGAIWH